MTAEAIARALNLKRSGHDYVGACPCCGYKSGFSVTEKDGKLLVYCAAGGCEQPGLWGALVKQGLVPDRDERRKAKPRRSPGEQAREMWNRSGPAATPSGMTTIVADYLRSRGITIPVPPVLRFLHQCRHRSGAVAPAMIALVEHTEHGPVAIHRSWLRPDGTGKADLDPNKMSLGPITGGAIRLAPIGPDGDLAVAEGIESALSFMQLTGGPTWAAISAGGIERLMLPPEARKIVIAADPDERGMRAARIAKHRWCGEGRQVWIARPTVDGDFNDALRARARRAA